MTNELLLMDVYGIYVWSAFIFTLLSFLSLYVIVKIQHTKEKKKFIAKFGTLNLEKASFAKSQSAIKEILSNSSYI